MPRKGFTRRFKPLDLASQEHILEICKATRHVLENTGVRFESQWAIEFLEKHGCKVDQENLRVRFPDTLVEECLRSAPCCFTVRARNPENDLALGGETLYFSHSSGMKTIDLATFEPREPTQSEYADCIRVLDALPTIDHLGCYPYFGYQGVCPAMAIPEGVALGMRYSSKHQAACCSNDCEIFTIPMAQATDQELTGTITSSSPLVWSESAVNAARRMVEAGFPITTVDGCVLGGSGPATIAGSVVVSNAEHLAMIVLVQLLNPGHRICIGHFALAMNMASGSPAFGQITSSLSNAVFNQVWRHYGLPVNDGSPGYVTAKTMDYQAGYEKATGAMAAALSGAHTILLHLGISSEITAHPVQAILDDDIAEMVGRFVEGEPVDAETIALDLIEQVGPIPGHYLNKAHTRKWWRKEQYVPRVGDKLTYPEWLAKGKPSALDYARERLEEILAKPSVPPLTPTQEADVARILGEAREYYRAWRS
ncbi:MAG: trimethylamine methyltransferase family protein [Chloroflexi bacterium]|nr:trimethylamine methyltransferase family protein [Chloroflexota bacterium]